MHTIDRRKIVNFSRRVDCAPFEDWFINRIRKGFAQGINPFTGKPYEVKLTAKDVKLVILWTKAPGNILRMVDELLSRDMNVAVFSTVNNYDKWLEPFVPELEENLAGLESLTRVVGVNAIWWRFDPIVPTNKQDLNWFVDHFGRLSMRMRGLTSRCITSIVHTEGPAKYRRCVGNINSAGAKVGQRLRLLTREEKLTWVGELSEVLYSNLRLPLEVCCHPFIDNEAVHRDQIKKWPEYLLSPDQILISAGYTHMRTSHCISSEALTSIGVRGDKRDGSHSLGSKRKGDIRYDLGMCFCRQSTDIGGTVACPHGCVYCQWPHISGQGEGSSRISAEPQVDTKSPSLTPL